MLKDKRILLMSGWYHPDSVGGTEVYVHSLGKELNAIGWNVMIAAPSIDEKEHNYTYEGLPVYRYPVSMNPTRYEVRGEAPPEYFDIFAKWIRHLRPDVVHIHSYTRGCGFFHAQYIKQLGIPVILTVHVPNLTCVQGTMMRWGKTPCNGEIQTCRCSACYLQKRGVPRLAAFAINATPMWLINRFDNMNNKLGTALQMRKLIAFRRERIQELFNLVDKIIVVSQWVYDVLRINGVPHSKLSLCRHGLPPEQLHRVKNNLNLGLDLNLKAQPQPKPQPDPPQPHPQPKPDKLRVGYIGRFNPVKGVHILIEAVKRLPLAIPIQLLLFGRVNDEEDRVYFDELKKMAGKDSRITFYGEMTDKNRQEIFDNLDILAVPSLCLETGPLVVLEAFEAGDPVIGSNLGGIAELVKDGVNGMLVKAGNSKSWADTLKKICLNPESLKDLASGIPSIRSSRDVVGEMSRLYESVLDSKKIVSRGVISIN